MCWPPPGTVVATSTKPDVAAVTTAARARRGWVWWRDPSGQGGTPEGFAALRWSPAPGCERWDTTVERSHALAGAAPRGR